MTIRADAYASVGRSIEAWSDANSLRLFTIFAGNEARFCYVSSSRGECLQIAIAPPTERDVRILVSDVETLHDEEFRREVIVPVSDLRRELDSVLASARVWLERESDKK